MAKVKHEQELSNVAVELTKGGKKRGKSEMCPWRPSLDSNQGLGALRAPRVAAPPPGRPGF